MPELLAAQGLTGLRYLSPLALLWLAYFFGRTLRPGATPLIERIARRSSATLPAALCRYTRALTAVWCAYFVLSAALCVALVWTGAPGFAYQGLAVLAGSVLLFAGEHAVRRRLFPHETFPGLLQQVRDTWSIWRTPERGAGTPVRR